MLRNEGRMDVMDLINGILGSLVSITAGCFLYHAWEAMLIGVIGACLACITMPMFDKMGVDDPVGASSVHGVCGIWGELNKHFNQHSTLQHKSSMLCDDNFDPSSRCHRRRSVR